MDSAVTITLTRDEALVLFEFFHRFQDTNEFVLRNNAEYCAFCRVGSQLDHAIVEAFAPNYLRLLNDARARVGGGYEGDAPGVVYE